MHELGIQSTMYRKRPKKPTTNTDTSQKPNLMRHLADLSGVVTTDCQGQFKNVGFRQKEM